MWAELKYSVRSFVRSPGLTLALLASIALGIGSNAAVLGFIRGLVTASERPAAVTERMVSVFSRDAQHGYGPLAFDRFVALAAQSPGLEQLGAARETQVSATIGDRLLSLSAAHVTPEMASLLQIPPDPGVIVSHRVWRDELTGRGAQDETRIRIGGMEHPVAAVAPEWLEGVFLGQPIDVWLPLDASTLTGAQRSSRMFWVLGRLRPGVSAADVQATVGEVVSDDELAILPYTGAGPETASGLSQLTRLLPVAAALVFFIACGNVMTLLLSRAAARAHESSVRVALGAGRRQLVRSLLADSLVVAVAGAAGGALLAMWTMDVVPAMFFLEDADELRFAPDAIGVIAIALACAALVTACGLVPLLDLRHDRPAAVLRRESAGPSLGIRRLRTGLVVAQIAVCSVLAVSTGLLLGGLRAALRTTAGQQLGTPVIANLEWRHGFDRIELGQEYFRKAEKALFELPDVTSLAWTATLPGGRPKWHTMRVEPAGLAWREVVLDVAAFTPETVDRIQLPASAGRLFGGGDQPGACTVGVVNDAAAQALFHGGSPIGRILLDPLKARVEIVGVVRERAPDQPARIYYYADQTPLPVGRPGPATFLAPVLSDEAADAVLNLNAVSPNYFDAMGFATTAGVIWPTGPSAARCGTAVVNQEAADMYFGGRAVGGAVIGERGGRTDIIGVVRTPRLRTSQRAGAPTIFFPTSRHFEPRMTLVLGTRVTTDATLKAVRSALGVGADSPVVTTLEAHLARTALATERIATVLFGAAAALALALAALGIYGAMADAVGRRRREFALRIALGAQRWRVIRQVIAEGVRLAGAGAVAGVLGSLAAAYWLAGITPVTGTLDVLTALVGPAVIGLLVLAASVIPARRALASNPLAILRE
jgi:ABC-type antimicrobial peptide transport system permease subunit